MSSLSLAIGVALLLVGVITFYTGMHSTDLIQNYYRIAYGEGFNIDEWEECSYANCKDYNSVYSEGMLLTRLSIIPVILGGIFFGYGFREVSV